jgi:hypothetical protein
MNSFKAVRWEFYQQHDKILRFVDQYPLTSKRTHFSCNCTLDTPTRPSIKPYEVKTSLSASFTRGKYNVEVKLLNSVLGHTFSWEEGDHHKHAYFWWPNNTLDHLQIEASQDLDHTFIMEMYFGDKVDTSHFFNGHSPTKLALDHLTSDDVWLHKCWWGREGVKVLPDSEEKSSWLRQYSIWSMMEAKLSSLRANLDTLSLPLLCSSAENDSYANHLINLSTDDLIKVLDNLHNTELFKLGTQILAQIQPLSPDEPVLR